MSREWSRDFRDRFHRFPTEMHEIRRVKELASLLKHGKWSYFLTITVNDHETPGVREITRAIERVAGDDLRVRKELTENFLPFVLRAWERFVRFLFQKLLMLNDSIIGKVKNVFYRFEFQSASTTASTPGTPGNKPHVHSGWTLVDESDIVSAKRISCDSKLFFSSLFGGDFDSLHKKGIVLDMEDYRRWQGLVMCVNMHDCGSAQYRCRKATNAEGDKICRYHRQPVMPSRTSDGVWFNEIPMPYTEEAYVTLQELGLAHKAHDEQIGEERWFVDDALLAGKWHYQSQQDELFLSTIPMLSAICRSSTNVDMCDRKFQVSYLVKYISGKEEHQPVHVSGTKVMNEVRATTEEHGHEKITSCRKLVEQKIKDKGHMGREICLAEVMWFNMSLPYTFCNADFVHVSTLPLENRIATVNRNFKMSSLVSGNTVREIPPVKGRTDANLEEWRQFRVDQLMHIDDYRQSPYLLDHTSAFNIRPPELLVFDNLQVYCECFVTASTQPCTFTEELSEQQWFDGLSHLVLIRSCSILKAVDFLTSKVRDGDFRAAHLLDCVFQPIVCGQVGFAELFVKNVVAQQVVSVISLVKPWDRTKFLAHLCLSLGRYVTEVDLFMNSSLRVGFVKAGLFPDGCELTRNHVLQVLRRYVIEDLRFHPISARKFGQYVTAASAALLDLLQDNIVYDYEPCVTNVMLKEQACDALIVKENLRREKLVSVLCTDSTLGPSIPQNLIDASILNPLHWIPRVMPANSISLDTIEEQNSALECCVKAVDFFLTPSCRGIKFPCLIGRPGSGKSHVLRIATAYALSKGLQVELMSFTSERARKLGGNHLHLVFPFGVGNGRVAFANDYASSCLSQLDKDPMKKAMLKRVDVIVFEEVGLLSAEHFTAMDTVLKTLMGNSAPMGGKLFMCCGDHKQLPCIDGRPLWGSLNLCTMMDIFIFTCDVRSRGDAVLQKVNTDCRRSLTAVECRTLAETVVRECRNEVDWSTVPEDAVRIVSTKAAEMKVVDEFLSGRATRSFEALDFVQNGSVWERASERVTRALNRNCYEYQTCKLYIGAVVRMTYNRRDDGASVFSQGQLAIVTRLPDESLDFMQQRMVLRLVPPGERHINPEEVPVDWREVSVGPRTTLPTVVGRSLQMGRRIQFPVRYYLASTIHRIQGDNVSLLATELSTKKRQYRLWQREQFAVLISRVHNCKDIIFVGDPEETKLAIQQIMSTSSDWDGLIEHYLNELNVASRDNYRARHLVMDVHPFLPLYREVPTTKCGYSYMLCSLTCCAPIYIGDCVDLRSELRKHNTGYGTEQTNNTALHPWGLYAFVYGFDETSENNSLLMRVVFNDQWRSRVRLDKSPDDAYALCCRIADECACDESPFGFAVKLTVVKCGQLA